MRSGWLHLYSKSVSWATFILIVAGGLVTSTDSGLSVPDWPLSYGQFFPPMIGGIRFEHTHRVIAGIVGILTLILAIFFLKKEERNWVRWIAWSAFGLVVAQAILGGLTVIYLLPTAISVLHACIAQTFFCLIASLALFTSKEWREGPDIISENAASLKRLLILTSSFIYLQLIAGAIVRHAHGQGVVYHILLAFLILLHAVFILLRISREPQVHAKLFSHAVVLGLIVVTQVFLGLGAYIMTLALPKAEMPRTGEVLFATAHQAMGALVLMTCVLLTLRAFRHLKETP